MKDEYFILEGSEITPEKIQESWRRFLADTEPVSDALNEFGISRDQSLVIYNTYMITRALEELSEAMIVLAQAMRRDDDDDDKPLPGEEWKRG